MYVFRRPLWFHPSPREGPFLCLEAFFPWYVLPVFLLTCCFQLANACPQHEIQRIAYELVQGIVSEGPSFRTFLFEDPCRNDYARPNVSITCAKMNLSPALLALQLATCSSLLWARRCAVGGCAKGGGLVTAGQVPFLARG